MNQVLDEYHDTSYLLSIRTAINIKIHNTPVYSFVFKRSNASQRCHHFTNFQQCRWKNEAIALLLRHKD